MLKLAVQNGPEAGRQISVAAELRVGRENADIVVADREVSRNHAVFRPADGGIELEDLGSTNGTWVNEVRITAPTRLSSGDIVRFGGTSILVIEEQARRPNTVAAPTPMLSGQIADPSPSGDALAPPAYPSGEGVPPQPMGGPTGPYSMPPDDNPLDDVATVLYLIAEQPNRRPKPTGNGWLFDGGEVFVVSDFLQFKFANGIVARQTTTHPRLPPGGDPPSVEDLAWAATYRYSIEFPNGRVLEVSI